MRTDADLVRESLREPQAFAAVFDRHFDAVHAFAQRRVGPDLGAEVAAETFTRAFMRRRTYDLARADARPWLLGIASNLLRRHWRSERRRLIAYARAADRADATGMPNVSEEVVAALTTLSKDERETLFLYALADFSYEEIAAALDCPVGTIRSRLARARGRLRVQLRGGSHGAHAHDVEESIHA